MRRVGIFTRGILFSGVDSLGGALLSASATVDAGIGIDFVVLGTLRDRFGGANFYAAAA